MNRFLVTCFILFIVSQSLIANSDQQNRLWIGVSTLIKLNALNFEYERFVAENEDYAIALSGGLGLMNIGSSTALGSGGTGTFNWYLLGINIIPKINKKSTIELGAVIGFLHNLKDRDKMRILPTPNFAYRFQNLHNGYFIKIYFQYGFGIGVGRAF